MGEKSGFLGGDTSVKIVERESVKQTRYNTVKINKGQTWQRPCTEARHVKESCDGLQRRGKGGNHTAAHKHYLPSLSLPVDLPNTCLKLKEVVSKERDKPGNNDPHPTFPTHAEKQSGTAVFNLTFTSNSVVRGFDPSLLRERYFT